MQKITQIGDERGIDIIFVCKRDDRFNNINIKSI